ncbi:MAG: hypothetical protein Q9227_004563 [Pyrenula ochraceoflavens]
MSFLDGRKWFDRTQKQDEALKPVHEAYEENDAFQRRIDSWLEERQLKSSVKRTKRELRQQIEQELEGLSLEDLKEATNNVIGEGLFRKKKWSSDRKVGPRAVGTHFQRFCANMAAFIEAGDVIIEIIKAAGEPFATVAYGTLSIFFLSVSHKVDNDDMIQTALGDMSRAFPRSATMSEIYPEPMIEQLVAKVFRAVLRFSISAVDYFSSTAVRFVNAAKPAKLGLSQSIEDVHKLLAELNAECGVLLHRNIVKLVAMNRDLQAKVDKLNRHNEDMLEREDRERLEETRRILRIDPDSPTIRTHTDAVQLKKKTNRAFANTMSSFKIGYYYPHMTSSRLSMEKAYRSWWSCDHSALLTLVGKTQEDSRSGPNGMSWLSPAAVCVHEQVRAEKKCMAFWTFYPELWQVNEYGHVHDAFAILLNQILRWRPSILRDQYTYLKQLLNPEEWAQPDSLKALDSIFKALTEVLGRIGHEETVYVVLDRCDQSYLKESYSLRKFVSLVKNLAFKVKVMLVMDATFSQDLTVSRYQEFIDEAPGRVFGKIDFDQPRESVL